MAAALTVYSKFGFQLQTEQGVQAAGNPMWLPIINDLGFVRSTNPEVVELADNCNFDRLVPSKGKWWQGSVNVLLCPGAASSLMTWIMDWDGWMQGVWATVWVRDGLGYIRTAMDVKVASARFEFASRAAVGVSLDLVGIGDGTNFNPTGKNDVLTVFPYIFKDAVLYHKPVGSGADEGIYCKAVSIAVDKVLDDPAEGLRMDGKYFPVTLYNQRAYRVTGSIERDYQNANTALAHQYQTESAAVPLNHWYNATYDGALGILISRGGAGIALEALRIRYTDWAPRISGSRSGVQTETAGFIALTDDGAGTTWPFTCSVSGG